MAAGDSTPLPSLALYVHLPWCIRKCPYCDFNSHALTGELPETRYVDALCLDLERELARVPGRIVESVFFGGGTPSLFSGRSFARLIDALAAHGALASDAEITMELNPGTVERGRLDAYREAGINRLSIGAQSFSPASLEALGRIHGADETVAVIGEARGAGFDNLNLDLMYGLPGQTRSEARVDVETAVALGVEHISYYQLTLEPNTRFHACPPELPDEDTIDAIYDVAERALREAGFHRYEVSAFARNGRECRHNLNYWRYGDYVGIGAGAHGKLSGSGGAVVRRVKPAHPRSYVAAIAAGETGNDSPIDPAEQVFELCLNGFRLVDGIEPAAIERLPEAARTRLARLLEQVRPSGLAAIEPDGAIRATDVGFRFLNDLQARFLP